MLKEGDKAPSFELPDQDGKVHKLADYKGNKVVLYFYPKDDTPGCTKEACNFRDEHTEIQNARAVVIGVSKDSVAKHKKFVDKYKLPFTLLSDESTEMLKSYGAWQNKKFMGKEYMGIQRMTYIIDEKGIIVKVFPSVKATSHIKEVMEAL
jgi:peroxiredoxin Q/BCP